MQVLAIMEYTESKNAIHVIGSNVRQYTRNGRQFETSCSRTMTPNVWPNRFKILYKPNKD